MPEPSKTDSTQQLIAEAEALGRPSKSRRRSDTKEMIAQAERLIGRAPPAATSKAWLWALLALAAAVVVAGILLYRR